MGWTLRNWLEVVPERRQDHGEFQTVFKFVSKNRNNHERNCIAYEIQAINDERKYMAMGLTYADIDEMIPRLLERIDSESRDNLLRDAIVNLNHEEFFKIQASIFKRRHLLSSSIRGLGLSTSAMELLEKNKIATIGELCQETADEIYLLCLDEGISKSTADEIEEKLKCHDLSLASGKS